MLTRITIRNYALIDSLDLEFSSGLNIVTGETGAGKSLLLGALSAILGGRTDSGILRDKDKPCVIEAEFAMDGFGLEKTFDSLDLDYDSHTVLRRVINPAGKSRAFVNDLPVNLTALRELGSRLVDIHSQHQTLLLGDSRFQTDLIDHVGGNTKWLFDYRTVYAEWKNTVRALEQLRRAIADNRKEEGYIRFQFEQLEQAALKEGESQELETLQNELTHAAEIKETLFHADSVFNGEEEGILNVLKAMSNAMDKISSFFPKGKELVQRLRSSREELKDIGSEILFEAERIEVDPVRLEKTEARLDQLYSLMQKHKVETVAELIAVREAYREKLAGISHADAEVTRLEKHAAQLENKAATLAAQLTAGRKKAAPGIEKTVCQMAASLGMPNTRFIVSVEPADSLKPDGADRIAFLFSANKNISPQPVESIASGGEMSRLMLCLKSLAARHKQLPTVVFDEIDTGISGVIADRTGEIIHDLSGHLQVINITHLPQVAAKGEHHYFVYKEDTATATNTLIRKLSAAERVQEIAKMLSGADITDAAIQQARTLLSGRS